MPLFRKGEDKKSKEAKRPKREVSVPPPEQPKPSSSPPASSAASAHPHRELAFHVQLAHGSPTKKVRDFRNAKELYQRIAAEFQISPAEILFCTLNTHKIDMTKLLGGQIGLEDFIFVHVHGRSKEVTLTKSAPSLGLTVTDNGAGCAFIKRIKEDSVLSKVREVSVGDHITSINGQSLAGCRHYEVAKHLKELPQHCDFTLKLIEPYKAFDQIAPRSSGAASKGISSLKANGAEEVVGSGRETLRLRANGPPVIETVEDTAWVVKAANLVDDLLESFMGIRDNELASTMVDLGKDVTEFAAFSIAMDGELGEFEFPEEFVQDVWSAIQRARQGT